MWKIIIIIKFYSPEEKQRKSIYYIVFTYGVCVWHNEKVDIFLGRILREIFDVIEIVLMIIVFTNQAFWKAPK